MHELGLVKGMLDVALALATERHATRITTFNVEMSATAHESPQALALHLETLAQGTVARGAKLEIVRIPSRVVCFHCGAEFASEDVDAACPVCASLAVRPARQDEFRLVSIDVE